MQITNWWNKLLQGIMQTLKMLTVQPRFLESVTCDK